MRKHAAFLSILVMGLATSALAQDRAERSADHESHHISMHQESRADGPSQQTAEMPMATTADLDNIKRDMTDALASKVTHHQAYAQSALASPGDARGGTTVASASDPNANVNNHDHFAPGGASALRNYGTHDHPQAHANPVAKSDAGGLTPRANVDDGYATHQDGQFTFANG